MSKTVILMRHGDYDYTESLSDLGQQEAQNVAQQMIDAGIQPDLILHSPVPRAVQTAAVVAEQYKAAGKQVSQLRVDEYFTARGWCQPVDWDTVNSLREAGAGGSNPLSPTSFFNTLTVRQFLKIITRLAAEYRQVLANEKSLPDSIRPSVLRNGRIALLCSEPIIYPAIADKVALLPSPQNVVAFYTRIHEINFLLVPTILSDPLIKKSILKEHNIRPLVDAFTDLLVFANGIINESNHNADFDEAVRKHIISENGNSISSSRKKFKLPEGSEP